MGGVGLTRDIPGMAARIVRGHVHMESNTRELSYFHGMDHGLDGHKIE
ncbi:hypothetical protein DSUL_60035 [Desulfovibrionales bacterium]